MKAYIDYQNLLKGEYKRNRRYGAFANHDFAMGATVRTNDFADRNLIIEPNEALLLFYSESSLLHDFNQIFDFICCQTVQAGE